MTSIKTMTIPALALALAALAMGPASAHLATGISIGDAHQSGPASTPKRGTEMAAMNPYITAKGQKSGSIKGKSPPPSPSAARGGGTGEARRTGVITEERK